jgi:acetate kinase
MKVLVLNCGSSTVKFQLIETDPELIARNQDRFLAKGSVEKIGTTEALVHFQSGDGRPAVKVAEVLDHRSGIAECLNLLRSSEVALTYERQDIGVIEHRVVHGGEKFSGSLEILFASCQSLFHRDPINFELISLRKMV